MSEISSREIKRTWKVAVRISETSTSPWGGEGGYLGMDGYRDGMASLACFFFIFLEPDSGSTTTLNIESISLRIKLHSLSLALTISKLLEFGGGVECYVAMASILVGMLTSPNSLASRN